eukprot:49040-Rhodomonas_salina.3
MSPLLLATSSLERSCSKTTVGMTRLRSGKDVVWGRWQLKVTKPMAKGNGTREGCKEITTTQVSRSFARCTMPDTDITYRAGGAVAAVAGHSEAQDPAVISAMCLHARSLLPSSDQASGATRRCHGRTWQYGYLSYQLGHQLYVPNCWTNSGASSQPQIANVQNGIGCATGHEICAAV